MQIVIIHSKRDNEILSRCIPYIIRYVSVNGIHIITQKDNIQEIRSKFSDSINVLNEDEIIPGLEFGNIKNGLKKCTIPEKRYGWYFQQFLKMAWAMNDLAKEWYMVWDSDTIPLHNIKFFDESGKPVFTTKTEFNKVYFETIYMILGLERQVNHSFIAENMLIKKSIMQELIKEIEKTDALDGNKFFEKIMAAIIKSSSPYYAFSEFETYGNYVISKYPDLYSVIIRMSCRKGARRFGLKPTNFDLSRLARRFEIVSFERWDRIIPVFIFLNKIISFLIYPFTKKYLK